MGAIPHDHDTLMSISETWTTETKHDALAASLNQLFVFLFGRIVSIYEKNK